MRCPAQGYNFCRSVQCNLLVGCRIQWRICIGAARSAKCPILPYLVRMPYAPLPDSEVICRVLEGDKLLFELRMRRYNQRLCRTCIALLD